MGLMSAAAQVLLILALQRAPASRLAPLNYFHLLLALVYSALWFGRWPDALALAGIALIVVAGLTQTLPAPSPSQPTRNPMSEIRDLAYWRARAATLRPQGRACIGGEWTDAADGATFDSINPANGRVLARVAACGAADVDRAVAAARRSFEQGVWAGLAPRERKVVLLRLAALIETHGEELALLETLDMGKPIGDTLAYDIPEAARTFAWYAEAIDKSTTKSRPLAAMCSPPSRASRWAWSRRWCRGTIRC